MELNFSTMKGVGVSVNVMKKENVPTEKIFGDFLELLEKDEADQFAGHLFEFIREVLASTMNLGKEGYSPALNFTVYARHRNGRTEIIMRPSRTASVEMFTVLQLDKLGDKLKTAMAEYAKEAWGMVPVIDEREDLRGVINVEFDAVDQWTGVVVKGDKEPKLH